MKSLKLNLFDMLALVIVVLFVSLALVLSSLSGGKGGAPAVLTVRVTANDEIIYPAVKVGQEVYLNGINEASRVTAVKKGVDGFDVTISGRGEKREDTFSFNGVRVVAGQKAEVHGPFFAQGIISEIKFDEN